MITKHARVSWLMSTAGLLALAGLGWPGQLALASPAQPAVSSAVQLTPSLTPSSAEWWLSNWQVPQNAWPLSQGAGVAVAVLDTGVQASVPDLRGVVLPGGDTTGAGSNGETDFDTGQDGHGTAVAVLIAGQGYGTGTVGIAPRARILPVHVAAPGAGSAVTIAAGIMYAVRHGAKVINMSPGPRVSSARSCDPALQDAVAYAVEHDVVVVAASGDTSAGAGPTEPASCAGVLAVGAVGPDGFLWPDSVRQPYVAVAAPGTFIVYVGRNGRDVTDGTGTSMASALVAGTAALVRARYPSMPWYQVDQRLVDTADTEGSPVPNDGYGYGIVDPAKAVDGSVYPVGAAAPNPVYAGFSAWLATPAGRAFVVRYHIPVRPKTPVRPRATARPRAAASPEAAKRPGTSGPGSPAGRVAGAAPAPYPVAGITLTEVVITAVAAAGVFVVVLMLVLKMPRRRGRREAGERHVRPAEATAERPAAYVPGDGSETPGPFGLNDEGGHGPEAW
jgi:type VII secretion-associated serine protease mycosin